jgi:hypothetical protein
MADQDSTKYATAIGKIVSNLLTVEALLRIATFNAEGGGAVHGDLDPATVVVGTRLPLNAITNYKPLKAVIARYNAVVPAEKRIDGAPIVRLRDALAHGRMLGRQPSEPFTLFKFGQGDGKTVPVELVVELTLPWLEEQRALVAEAIKRMLAGMGESATPVSKTGGV